MRSKVIDIMAKTFSIDKSLIPADIAYGMHEKWDSVQHLNLIVELESGFGVYFEPEEILEMTSIDKIINCIEKKK